MEVSLAVKYKTFSRPVSDYIFATTKFKYKNIDCNTFHKRIQFHP